MIAFLTILVAATQSANVAPVSVATPPSVVHQSKSGMAAKVIQEWQSYLMKRREFLMSQLRYIAAHRSRFEEIRDGKRTDVSDDWLNQTQDEYAQVTQLLIDADLLTEEQARADASR